MQLDKFNKAMRIIQALDQLREFEADIVHGMAAGKEFFVGPKYSAVVPVSEDLVFLIRQKLLVDIGELEDELHAL